MPLKDETFPSRSRGVSTTPTRDERPSRPRFRRTLPHHTGSLRSEDETLSSTPWRDSVVGVPPSPSPTLWRDRRVRVTLLFPSPSSVDVRGERRPLFGLCGRSRRRREGPSPASTIELDDVRADPPGSDLRPPPPNRPRLLSVYKRFQSSSTLV